MTLRFLVIATSSTLYTWEYRSAPDHPSSNHLDGPIRYSERDFERVVQMQDVGDKHGQVCFFNLDFFLTLRFDYTL